MDEKFSELPLGQLLSLRAGLYRRKKEIESGELTSIKSELDDCDGAIIRKMQDAGLRQAQDESGTATFHVTDEVVPKISDFDALYDYIAKNGYWQLLYRKITARAYREIIEAGETVPGTDPEVVTRLRMRSN